MTDKQLALYVTEYNELQIIQTASEDDRIAIARRLSELREIIGRESAKRHGWS